MNIVAIHGLKGGVGTTTIVSNLAAAINAQSQPVLAIDLCSQNSLRLHFGMALQNENGFASQIAHHRPWHEAGYQSYNGVNFLPFGQDQDNKCINAIELYIRNHPNWLNDWLSTLDMPENTWVLLDCPLHPSPFHQDALKIADISLLVVNPEMLSYTCLHAPNRPRHLYLNSEQNQLMLLNRYCPSIDLERDITSLIKTDFAASLLPITIHRDEHLREAFAFKKSVIDAAPASQSAQDFSLAAFWLTARQAKLAQKREEEETELQLSKQPQGKAKITQITSRP